MVIISTIINRATSGTIKHCWYVKEKDVVWPKDESLTLTHSVMETNNSQLLFLILYSEYKVVCTLYRDYSHTFSDCC